MMYGKEKDQVLRWKILPDREHIEDEKFKPPEHVDMKEVDMTDKSFADVFFDEFFPDLKGSACIIDKYHSDPASEMYESVQQQNIKFHDNDAEDKDWNQSSSVSF